MKFIGRKKELNQLKNLFSSNQSNLVVINGRRRIGKSRLVEEFAKSYRFLAFSGLAPIEGVTAQDQRDAFARQFIQYFQMPPLSFMDWSDAFNHLNLHIEDSPTVILFDEISWMASGDKTFLPKLKVWWDISLEKHSKLMLILCGSVSTWIDKNIINSTAFFGRIALHITLDELSLPECNDFLQEINFKQSFYDIFKMLSVIGGIPWYLKRILPSYTADENIRSLCFEKNGVLVKEFDRIFHDLFHRRSFVYKNIVTVLSDGMQSFSQIRKAINYTPGGIVNRYLKDLVIAGFLAKHYTWTIKTKKISRQSLYRLSDNYLRFFLKYIEPNFPKIQNNAFQEFVLSGLPGWESIMGFQIENLLLKNRNLILKALGISTQDIVVDNPYIQSSTSRKKGCQIDYLIQTRTNNLFICEFKYNRREIRTEVIDEMQKKIKKLSIPRGFGVCPVLIYLGEISSSVVEKNYFYRIINMADFLFPME